MARSLFLKFRRGTAAAWASANPTLGQGEPGYETDSGLVKVGDGASAYAALGALASQAYAQAQAALRLHLQGAWASGTAYAVNDVVVYNGKLYACTTAVPASAGSYVGSCKVNSVTAAGANVPLPAGAAAGDFLLLAQSDYAGALVAPIGTTVVASAANSNGHYQLVSKTLTSTDITNGYLAIPAQTGANNWAVAGEVFRNVSIETTTIGQTVTASSPAITPTGAAFVISISWNLHDTSADGSMTQAALSGFVTQGTPSGAFGACVGMGYDTIASGSSSARAFTTAGNGAVSDSAAIALLTAGFDPSKWTFIGNADANLPPAGSVMLYGAVAAPSGYLLCDGTSYLRAAYPALFAVIGTLYGSADSTHFTVPDLRGRFPIGLGSAPVNTLGGTGGVTAHNHTLSDAAAAEIYQSATGYTAGRRITLPGAASFAETTRISGSSVATGTGQTLGSPLTGATDSTTGLYPPYQVMNYIIKT